MKNRRYIVILAIIIWIVGFGLLSRLFDDDTDYSELKTALLFAWTVAVFGRAVQLRAKAQASAQEEHQDPAAEDTGGGDFARLTRPLRLEMLYKSANDEVQRRVVDVTAVSFYDSRERRGEAAEYLRAYCHLRKAPRTFRADRIHELVLPDGQVLSGGTYAERKTITKRLGALARTALS